MVFGSLSGGELRLAESRGDEEEAKHREALGALQDVFHL